MPVNPTTNPEESAEHYAGDEEHFAQKEELDEIIDPYREEFIKLVIQQEKDIDKELVHLSSEIEGLSKKNQPSDLQIKVAPIIQGFFLGWFANLIVNNSTKTAEINGAWHINEVNEHFNGLYTESITQKTQQTTNYLTNTLLQRKDPFNGITIGEKITWLSSGSLNAVRNIIRVGIDEGWSNVQMAKNIENYVIKPDVSLWTSPYEYFRKAFGFERRQPSLIPAGSIEYNAKRIARTEINNTWRQATLLSYKDMPWIAGYDWNLSPSHPVVDICDEWAEGSPYTYEEISKFGHPHCMCNITVRFKDEILEPRKQDKEDLLGALDEFDFSKLEKLGIDIEKTDDDTLRELQAMFYEKQGFNGKPKVTNQKELDKLIKNGNIECFRGVNSKSSIIDFKTGDTHYVGRGVYGNGTYTAVNRITARGYAGHKNEKGEWTDILNVMRYSLSKDSKIIDYKTLVAEMDSYRAKIQSPYERLSKKMDELKKENPSDEQLKKLYDEFNVEYKRQLNMSEAVFGEPGIFATLRGYDAIQVKYGSNDDYYVILNRSKVTMENNYETRAK